VLELDLADARSIERFAVALRALLDTLSTARLHALVLNAGVMDVPLSHTAQGLELQVGVNAVGHHLLARLLRATMERDSTRLVWLSSVAHRLVSWSRVKHLPRPLSHARPFEGMAAVPAALYDPSEQYLLSKAGCALLAISWEEEWANRYGDARTQRPRSFACTPGYTVSALQERVGVRWRRALYAVLKHAALAVGFAQPWREGALPAVLCAAADTRLLDLLWRGDGEQLGEHHIAPASWMTLAGPAAQQPLCGELFAGRGSPAERRRVWVAFRAEADRLCDRLEARRLD
jgi:NAD(P)-dependent dehydrogenase (short-subunit alcohol dehydrogenase family)